MKQTLVESLEERGDKLLDLTEELTGLHVGRCRGGDHCCGDVSEVDDG